MLGNTLLHYVLYMAVHGEYGLQISCRNYRRFLYTMILKSTLRTWTLVIGF